MNTLHLIFAWAAAHPTTAAAILFASPSFIRALLRTVFAPLFVVWPRSRALVDGLLALVPLADLWRASLKLIEAATGQHLDPYPDPRDEEIARRGSQIATLQQEVARLQTGQPARVREALADTAPPASITAGAERAKPTVPATESIHDSDGSNGEH